MYSFNKDKPQFYLEALFTKHNDHTCEKEPFNYWALRGIPCKRPRI